MPVAISTNATNPLSLSHEQVTPPSGTRELTMKSQAEAQQQPNSPNRNGYPNGHGIKPSNSNSVKKIGEEQEERVGVPIVAINGGGEEAGRSSISESLDAANATGSQQLTTPTMQAVDLDSADPLSAALAPPSGTSSPITPTPSSMSFLFQQRRHPTQLDLSSHLEVPNSIQSPESSSNSNTPRPSSSVLLSSSGGCKEEDGEGEKVPQVAKIVIPDSTALGISTTIDSSSTPLTSRPPSTSIDPNLFSNRPAPPSPSLSRRVSGAPSVASASSPRSRSRSRSSRPPSLGMSRVNSLRMSGVGSDARRQSLGTQLSQFMASGVGNGANRDGGSATPTSLVLAGSPLGSPNKLTFAQPPQSSSTQQASTNSPSTSTTSPTAFAIPYPSDPTTSDPTTSDPMPTATATPTATTSSVPPSTPPPVPTPHIYIKVRDFGFPSTDERHLGLGPAIPKANRVHRLNRKLGGPDRARARAAAIASGSDSASAKRPDSFASVGSMDSSDADVEEEEDGEDEGWGIGISGWGKGGGGGGGKGWDGFRMGMGRFSWTMGSSNSSNQNVNNASDNKNASHSKGTSSNSNDAFPSRKDLDMNFMDSSSSSSEDHQEAFDADNYDDTDPDGLNPVDDEDQPQEPLYPGLYRALYAFEPEGTAEMKLDEDQIVRVVGRGGGVGWAVVVDEAGSGDGVVKHALVPEGYLEVVRLDWEDEEELEGLEVMEDGGKAGGA